MKEWYLKNKDKLKIYSKEYHLKNKDKIRQRIRKYYTKNREKILKYIREYYLKNKDKISKFKKQYNLKKKTMVRVRTSNKQLHCQKCDWFWIPKTSNPIKCPRCHRKTWRNFKI